MATVFFGCEDVIYPKCMAKGTTITADSYYKSLQNLKKGNQLSLMW